MAESFAAVVAALAHALLHFLWQGALIGLGAMLALHALRQARPQLRYAVACIALLACVLAPVFTTVAHLAATSLVPSAAVPHILLPSLAAASQTSATHGVLAVAATARFGAVLPWIVALWAAGACLMLLRLALGLDEIRRLRQTPQGSLQAVWQLRLDTLAVRFGLRHGVLLRLVDSLDSPVSAGWWRPVVLLPTALLTRMPAALVEALLAHELAHIRRHDYLVNLLQNVVEALLFYHPVTWWLSQRIRAERECIADQIAAEVTGAPQHLAFALSALCELQRDGAAVLLAQAAHGGDLLARIRQLVRPQQPTHYRASLAFSLLGLAAVCIACYAYASIPAHAAATTLSGVPAVRSGRLPDTAVKTTFALVSKAGAPLSIWGPSDDRAAIEAARRRTDGEFLWVRRAGVDYVVSDASLLALARQAWHETDTLSRQIDMLSTEMADRYQKAEILRGRIDALSAPAAASPEIGEAQAARAVAASQQQAAQKNWNTLASEAEAANESLQALGRRIEQLVRERTQAASRTERELHSLVENALAAGLAKRAPPHTWTARR